MHRPVPAARMRGMKTIIRWLALLLSLACFYRLAHWVRWVYMIYSLNGRSLWSVYCGTWPSIWMEIVVSAVLGPALLWVFAAGFGPSGRQLDPPA